MERGLFGKPLVTGFDVTRAKQDAERGDAPDCVSCGWGIPWGGGHQVEDKDTGQPVWLCCPCFERETLAAFAEMKAQREEEP